MLRLAPIFFVSVLSFALHIVTTAEREIDGAKVTFEEVDGRYSRALKVVRDGETLTVLVPGAEPTLVTNGREIFKLDFHYRKSGSLAIGKGGTVLIREGQKVEPTEVKDRSIRAQLNVHLLSLPMKDRPGELVDVEQFLLDVIRDSEKPVVPLGITAGSTILQGTEKYTVFGQERYPGLLGKGDELFYFDVAAGTISPLRITRRPPQLLIGNGKGHSAAPAPAQLAFFRKTADAPDGIKAETFPLLQKILSAGGKEFSFDINRGVQPSFLTRGDLTDEKGNPLDREQVYLRALNFAMNLIGKNPKAAPVTTRSLGGGKFIAEVSPFIGAEKVARIASLNPYACSVGDLPIIRLDWLLSVLQEDETYRVLADIPASLVALENELGVKAGLQPHTNENQNVGIPVSGVAVAVRALNRQAQKKRGGLGFYQSFDAASDKQGLLVNPDADFSKNPSGFQHDVGEFIYLKPNHYEAFAIYKAVPPNSPNFGAKLPAATDSLVSDSETPFGPFVHNPRSCLECHSAGMRSPDEGTVASPREWMLSEEAFAMDKQAKKRYSSYAEYKAAVERFFGDVTQFLKDAEADKQSFRQALIDSKGFIKKGKGKEPEAPLGRFFRSYHENVDLNQAARELGTNPEALRKVIEAAGPFRVDEAPVTGGEKTVRNVAFDRGRDSFPRKDFEAVYCQLKAKLEEAGGSAAGPTATPSGH